VRRDVLVTCEKITARDPLNRRKPAVQRHSKTRKGENMAERRSIRFVAFIVRCAAAATCAYGAAILTGLPHPVWAAISALVVSQERLGQTGASLLWRIAGTLIGLCVAVAAGTRHPVSCRLDLGIAYRQDNIPRS